MPSIAATKCEVCKEELSKYKCPRCLIKYCSLKCFKSHKDESSEIKCVERKPEPNAPEPIPSSTIPDLPWNKYNEDVLSKDQVPFHLLQKLGDSEALKEKLQNPHLCDIISNLDKSDNPNGLIEKLMKEPIFEEFADECLKVVEPKEETK